MLPERKINFSKPNSLSLADVLCVSCGLHSTILYHWSNHFTIWESDLQLIHLWSVWPEPTLLKIRNAMCILLRFFSVPMVGGIANICLKLFQTKIIIASHYSLELWISIACSPVSEQAVGLLLGVFSSLPVVCPLPHCSAEVISS